MITIKFHQSAIVLPIEELSDACIEAARLEVESQEGSPLELDPRTQFPPFTVYQDGSTLGGG